MPTIHETYDFQDESIPEEAGNVDGKGSMVDSAALMGTQNPARKATTESVDSAVLMVSQRDTRQVERIGTLEIIEEDREICSIIENGWEEIEFAVDSGASETVVGPEMIESAETRQGAASRRNICYEVANGVRIANFGRKAGSISQL